MCRWLAYSGAPLYLEQLLLKPQNSLIHQSLSAREGAEKTNGDGFGLGWYDERPEPGVYKHTEPAWNDRNLADLTRHIKSPMFLAHVRAATGTPIQKTNCHPFRYGGWLLVHNGVIRGFTRLKRALAFEIAPALYPRIEGTTDSEIMFYLALTLGLEDEPLKALEQMAGLIEQIGGEHAVEYPLQMTLGLSDGQRLFAVRYSSERQSRTLYHSKSIEGLREINPAFERFSKDACVVVSEPLSEMTEYWEEIPESSALVIAGGEIATFGFEPRPPG